MITKKFIEEYSLFRKFKPEQIHNDVRKWNKIPINMKCYECGSVQTFNMTNEYYHDKINSNNMWAQNRVLDLRFVCESCKKFERRFFIFVNQELNTMYKVGQYPEWEIKIDKNLEKILHKHKSNFRKGLVCETQGYGIGAFSYYRRITEEIIDELLASISDLIEEEHKAEYQKALEKTKKTRVAQEKINLVKDLLPTILKPNGMNPLGVLHSELSKGLHASTDELCLENANHIKIF
jgi:ribosomal protein L44E